MLDLDSQLSQAPHHMGAMGKCSSSSCTVGSVLVSCCQHGTVPISRVQPPRFLSWALTSRDAKLTRNSKASSVWRCQGSLTVFRLQARSHGEMSWVVEVMRRCPRVRWGGTDTTKAFQQSKAAWNATAPRLDKKQAFFLQGTGSNSLLPHVNVARVLPWKSIWCGWSSQWTWGTPVEGTARPHQFIGRGCPQPTIGCLWFIPQHPHCREAGEPVTSHNTTRHIRTHCT